MVLIVLSACLEQHRPFEAPATVEPATDTWSCPGYRISEHRPLDAGLVAGDGDLHLYDDSLRRGEEVWRLEGAGRALATRDGVTWVATHRGVERLTDAAHDRWWTGGTPVAIATGPAQVWVADAAGRVLAFDAGGLRETHQVDGWPRSIAAWGEGALLGRTHLPPRAVSTEVPDWVGVTPWLAGDGERLWAVQDGALVRDGTPLAAVSGKLAALWLDRGLPSMRLADETILSWDGERLVQRRSGSTALVDVAAGPLALGADGRLHGADLPDLRAPSRALLRHGDALLVTTDSGVVRVSDDLETVALASHSVTALASSQGRVFALAPDLGAVELDPSTWETVATLPPDPRRVPCSLAGHQGEAALSFLTLPGLAVGGTPWRYTSLAALPRAGFQCTTPRELDGALYVPLPRYGLERVDDGERWRFHPGAWDVTLLSDELVVARGTAGVATVTGEGVEPCTLPGTIRQLWSDGRQLVALSRSSWTVLTPR